MRKATTPSTKTRLVPSPTTNRVRASIQEISVRLVRQVDECLGSYCPVTGLFSPTTLPPLNGLVMQAHHPIALNAPLILEQPDYWRALPAPAQIGLALAALNTRQLLELEGSALAVNAALEARLLPEQRLAWLTWIASTLLAPKPLGKARKRQPTMPTLSLSPSTATEDAILGHMARCQSVLELEEQQAVAAAKAHQLPAFLSSAKQAPQLNRDCYEVWIEAKPFLPASLVEKAKPFIKTLATIPDQQLVERLVTAVQATCPGYEDGTAADADFASAVYEFGSVVREAWAKADRLGLHASAFDTEPLLEPTPAPIPVPTPAVEATPSQAATPSPMTFLERMALRKAAKGA